MARPHKEINREYFEDLCAMQYTLREIAWFFDCSQRTVEKWCLRTYQAPFREVFKEKRRKGFVKLREAQFRLAETNPTMAIFLGKNYLGQFDTNSLEVKEGAEVDKLDMVLAQLNTGF